MSQVTATLQCDLSGQASRRMPNSTHDPACHQPGTTAASSAELGDLANGSEDMMTD
jgi:hypothetical protein